jgi:hypothetical protein
LKHLVGNFCETGRERQKVFKRLQSGFFQIELSVVSPFTGGNQIIFQRPIFVGICEIDCPGFDTAGDFLKEQCFVK